MPFVDFSLAFNTIAPQPLVDKLELLGFNIPLGNWNLYFLTDKDSSMCKLGLVFF